MCQPVPIGTELPRAEDLSSYLSNNVTLAVSLGEDFISRDGSIQGKTRETRILQASNYKIPLPPRYPYPGKRDSATLSKLLEQHIGDEDLKHSKIQEKQPERKEPVPDLDPDLGRIEQEQEQEQEEEEEEVPRKAEPTNTAGEAQYPSSQEQLCFHGRFPVFAGINVCVSVCVFPPCSQVHVCVCVDGSSHAHR